MAPINKNDNFDHEVPPIEPVQLGNLEILKYVIDKFERSKHRDARDLARLFKNPYLKALVNAHDQIGEIQLEKLSHPDIDIDITAIYTNPVDITDEMPREIIKMVSLSRKGNEPLGLTVEVDENGQLIVARILAGGMIDKMGMLHPGDTILEVNATPVSTPEELQNEILSAKQKITLKVVPGVDQEMKSAKLSMAPKATKNLEPGKKLSCYMRALFSYDPSEDTLLPCKEIGLPFQQGDILQIINVNDPNWWQAKHVSGDGSIGLIPSLELEERRKAYVPPEADFVHKIGICGTRVSKKKKKILYKSKENTEFDKADLTLYEEVTRMPPFKRKTLVLIGVQGVGRRTLKTRLINSDPDNLAGVIPHTSRPIRALEENGQGYWFTDRETMEHDIRENRFLEYGEHNANLYGTHLDSIRNVIKSGRMCIIDCNASSLKMLHNSPEFMPYVVFLAAPGLEELKKLYSERRAAGGSQRNLAFDRQSSIRFSSRRARTLESLASLYEDDDFVSTVEESMLLQRKYEKYIDLVVVNEDFDTTFRKVVEALESLSHEHQWIPVNWIY